MDASLIAYSLENLPNCLNYLHPEIMDAPFTSQTDGVMPCTIYS